MKTVTFEDDVRKALDLLRAKELEYKESTDNKLNSDFYKGKADAYEFAVKVIERVFTWHNLTSK